MQNQTIVDHLKQIAHLFLKDKDQWRSRAFSKVAGHIEISQVPLEFNGGLLVTKIPGVGKAIQDVIQEFVTGGTSRKLEKLKERLPNEVVERFEAKTCKQKVTTILKPLTEAGVDWGFAGSMRRGSPTVRDVDVIVCLNDEDNERALVERILKDNGFETVRHGREKIGMQVPIKSQGRYFTLDLNFTYPEKKGAMYLYFTGPKAYNIGQRALAKSMGLRMNQNGLFKNGKCIASETEEDMFKALGLDYVAPNKRA